MERLTIAALGPEDVPGTNPAETIFGTSVQEDDDHSVHDRTTYHAYIEYTQELDIYKDVKKEVKKRLCKMMVTRKKICTLLLQKVFGSYVVDNAFYEVGMGTNLAGPFGVTGTDVMHANDEGVSKDAMQVIVNPMTNVQKEQLDRLANCLINAPYNRGYAKSNLFPRCDFSGGFSSLTNLTADENAGKLIVVSLLLETLSGLELFRQRTAPDFDQKKRDVRDQLSGRKKTAGNKTRRTDAPYKTSAKRRKFGTTADKFADDGEKKYPYTPLLPKGEGNDKMTYMFVWDKDNESGKWVEGITSHCWIEIHPTGLQRKPTRFNTYHNEYQDEDGVTRRNTIYDRELLLAMEASMLKEEYKKHSYIASVGPLKKDAINLKIRNWVKEEIKQGTDKYSWKRITGKVKKYLPNPDRIDKKEKSYLVRYDDNQDEDEYLDEEEIRNMLVIPRARYWGGGKRGMFTNADMVSVDERLSYQLERHGLPFLMEWKTHMSDYHRNRLLLHCYKELRELPKNDSYHKDNLDQLRIPSKERDDGTWKHCADRRKQLFSQGCVNRYRAGEEQLDVMDINSPYVVYGFVQGIQTSFPAEEECVAHDSDDDDSEDEDDSPEDQHVSLNMNGDVNLLRRIVQLLCGMTAFLRYGNRVTDNNRRQRIEEAVRLTIQELTEMVSRDTNSLGWNKQKVHDLLHVVMYDLALFGSPTNNTTDKGESGLKTWAKRPATYAGLATGAENFTKRVAMHYYWTRLVECGEDHYRTFVEKETKVGILRFPYIRLNRSIRKYDTTGRSKHQKFVTDKIVDKLCEAETCQKNTIVIYSEAVVEAAINGPNEKLVQFCYRADPNYNGNGAWYDWCWMRVNYLDEENEEE